MSEDIRILHFSPLQVWVTSCFAFKLQFLDVHDFMNTLDMSDEKAKMITKGNLLKSVADWHNEICGVLTKKFVKEHTPKFVKDVIDDANLTVPNDSGASSDIMMCDPFNLHVTLLIKASEMMISCLKNYDLSGDTVSAIKNWFELFEQAEFVEFLRFGENYEEWNCNLVSLKLSYAIAIDVDTIGSGELGQFFDPSTLFLYLAHAVFMECYDPSFVRIGRNSKHEQTTGQNRSKETLAWQEACGSLVKWRFAYDSFKGMTGYRDLAFPILSSLNPMRPGIEMNMQQGKAPPVHAIHYQLLKKMHTVLNEKAQEGGFRINDREDYAFGVLDIMLDTLDKSTEDQMSKMLGREKYFRNSVRKGGGRFRINRLFNNDMFLMGDDSFANITKCQKEQRKGKCDEFANIF